MDQDPTQPGGEMLTVDQLAARAGMTVRNVRAHQSIGLLPPPRLRGRTGWYGPEHLERLELIRILRADGFNLAAIRRLLTALPAGVAAEMLGFERALRAPWVEEQPEVVDVAELGQRFAGGAPADPVAVERAERLGVLRRVEGDRVELRSPSLARAGEELVRLGIPIDAVLDVEETLAGNSKAVAEAFVGLFLDSVWKPFVERGQPEAEWERIRHALEVMRSLAMEAVIATFRIQMTAAADEALGRVLDGVAREVEESLGADAPAAGSTPKPGDGAA
jgi:DNA-binding transcriptional MerR regulator